MKVSIDTTLEGLGEILAKLLPRNAAPTSVRLTATELRVDLKVPVAFVSKSVALTARAQSSPGSLRLHGFAMEGALGFGEGALEDLRKTVAKLDERYGAFRVTGEKGGDGLLVAWK